MSDRVTCERCGKSGPVCASAYPDNADAVEYATVKAMEAEGIHDYVSDKPNARRLLRLCDACAGGGR